MSLLDDLGIEVVEKGKHKVVLEMDLTAEQLAKKQDQNDIKALLSETAASIGANLNMDPTSAAKVLTVSIHNLNALKAGRLVVEAISIRNGDNVQTWQAVTHFSDSAITNSLSTVTLKKIQI
ncbi:aromatic compound catabolic protein [Companilactobacillus sp. FL22-1]|uniref:aromatic compound catabolic protein n=1 Tax=Companilactobacillus sp. FL22-1 TaxID=3373892 RepID=UPI0037552FA8